MKANSSVGGTRRTILLLALLIGLLLTCTACSAKTTPERWSMQAEEFWSQGQKTSVYLNGVLKQERDVYIGTVVKVSVEDRVTVVIFADGEVLALLGERNPTSLLQLSLDEPVMFVVKDHSYYLDYYQQPVPEKYLPFGSGQ